MNKSIADQLRDLGIPEDSIASATVDGKPLGGARLSSPASSPPQAVGRAHGKPDAKDGLNKTERAYAAHLDMRVKAGEVRNYIAHPCGLRLGVKTFYHPDFMVVLTCGEVQIHEVKGYWEDDARVKIKVAADMFPFEFIAVTRERGSWKYEHIKSTGRKP